MGVPIVGNAGVIAEVDEARNLQTIPGIPGYPAAGGFYSVSGGTTAVVAAGLAADTMLMSARMSAVSSRKAYITKIKVHLWAGTANAAAVVPGVLGFRRFTAQTPTGGTARTANRFSETKGTATDITDIRDSNAALTGSAPTWGNVIDQSPIPVLQGAVAAGMCLTDGEDWLMEFDAPLELAAGDGVALRTIVAGPATATWGYSYTMEWYER